ncbi:MAG: hypothetical protein ACHRXM_28640 [Isosphaerales bacterium]
MADEACNLDRRSLARLFPGLRLVGALRLAFDLRKLIIAALGLALLQLGWSLIDGLFPASAAVTPDMHTAAAPVGLATGVVWTWETLAALHSRLSEPIRLLTTPLFALLEPRSSWGTMVHALLSLMWLMIIWSICGCAIARIAIVQVAKLRQTGTGEALRFSLWSWSHLIVPSLCPLLGLAICGAFTGAFGLLYRLPVAGPALAGAILVIPLAAGLMMILLVAGLVAGWPLMHAAVAAGAEDALDAMSRTFGYLNQRIGPFLALMVFVWLEGIIGLQLVDLLTGGVIRLTQWGLGLTAPEGPVAALFGGAGAPAGPVAAATHTFWLGVVGLLAHGWIYSFFWTAAALLYLWLRHDVDGTPWSEIETGRMVLSTEATPIVAVPDTSPSPSAEPGPE